jgi:hypothetical protein
MELENDWDIIIFNVIFIQINVTLYYISSKINM